MYMQPIFNDSETFADTGIVNNHGGKFDQTLSTVFSRVLKKVFPIQDF